jgi:hypothetical protein
VQRLRSGASLDEVWQFYKGARDSARNALYTADSYFAIDVSLWAPCDLLRQSDWDPERQAELEADILDGIDRVDPSQLDPEQQQWFEERRIKVAQILGDKSLEREALDALDKMGSKAGIFLQAHAIGGFLRGSGKTTDEDASKANSVILFMKDHYEKIRDDARCLRYFLRGLWLSSTKSYLFGGERSPIPEGEEALQEILSLLDILANLEGTLGDPRTQYLRAILMWRLRRENSARDIWNTLSLETAFSDPRRVVRHHVWTESGGQPKLFHGRVTTYSPGSGRVQVQVEELRQEVGLLQRDFPNLELQRGAAISGGFHIAFNFIGPVADPPRRFGSGR